VPHRDADFLLTAHLALLDALAPAAAPPLSSAHFDHLTATVNNRVSAWYRSHGRIVAVLLPLLPHIKGLLAAGTGTRLRLVLEIFDAVAAVDATLPASQWQDMFEWVMRQTDDRRTLEAFALWGRHIRLNPQLREHLCVKTRSRIDRLLDAFTAALRPNQQLRLEFDALVNG
jgi:hypothetical protein